MLFSKALRCGLKEMEVTMQFRNVQEYDGDFSSNLDVSEIDKMVDYAHEVLGDNGYSPYYLYRQKYMAGSLENTGYFKGDTKCVYNIGVMEEISRNLACGAGAISKEVKFDQEKIERLPAPKDVKTYIEKIDQIIEEKSRFFG
jgi:oxygen-independent coproporphyrinogen-3 oxidase